MAATGARRDRGGGPVDSIGGRDSRQAILDGTEELLANKRFDELRVADIIAAAEVSRATFYFYFESKCAVLAELARSAVSRGYQAVEPVFIQLDDIDLRARVRAGVVNAFRLWREQAPILRAVVENWQSDASLRQIWLELVQQFADGMATRIEHEGSMRDVDCEPHALASVLTWLGEHSYYLAAAGVSPFDDEEVIADVMTEIWMGTVYRGHDNGAST
jgi:TetR/AcrR family transcriptional regulator, ethionamide resistance regulator